MQLNPHYGADPVLVLEGDPTAILDPTIRQRRRLAATIVGLTDTEWAHPSRCEGWSARERHRASRRHQRLLDTVDRRGAPRRTDPVPRERSIPLTSPARSVARSQQLSSAEVRDRFIESTDALCTLLESLGTDDWTLLAEAPPGHVTISAVAHHALWDAWVHERDILLPLEADAGAADDEVTACLRWVAALGPTLARSRGVNDHGRLAIRATDPDTVVLIDIGRHVVVTDEAETPISRWSGLPSDSSTVEHSPTVEPDHPSGDSLDARRSRDDVRQRLRTGNDQPASSGSVSRTAARHRCSMPGHHAIDLDVEREAERDPHGNENAEHTDALETRIDGDGLDHVSGDEHLETEDQRTAEAPPDVDEEALEVAEVADATDQCDDSADRDDRHTDGLEHEDDVLHRSLERHAQHPAAQRSTGLWRTACLTASPDLVDESEDRDGVCSSSRHREDRWP